MAKHLDNTAEIHKLFKAFHELNVPHKRDACEELRVLILDKRVSGKASIASIINDAAVMNACSAMLRNAINAVVQINNTNTNYTEMSNEDDEDDDDYEEEYDDDDADEDDYENDPDYEPLFRDWKPNRKTGYDKIKSEGMLDISKNIKEAGNRLENYANEGRYNEIRFIVKYLEMTVKVLDAINK